MLVKLCTIRLGSWQQNRKKIFLVVFRSLGKREFCVQPISSPNKINYPRHISSYCNDVLSMLRINWEIIGRLAF